MNSSRFNDKLAETLSKLIKAAIEERYKLSIMHYPNPPRLLACEKVAESIVCEAYQLYYKALPKEDKLVLHDSYNALENDSIQMRPWKKLVKECFIQAKLDITELFENFDEYLAVMNFKSMFDHSQKKLYIENVIDKSMNSLKLAGFIGFLAAPNNAEKIQKQPLHMLALCLEESMPMKYAMLGIKNSTQYSEIIYTNDDAIAITIDNDVKKSAIDGYLNLYNKTHAI